MRYQITTAALPLPLVAPSLPRAMDFARAFIEQGHAVTITPIEKDAK